MSTNDNFLKLKKDNRHDPQVHDLKYWNGGGGAIRENKSNTYRIYTLYIYTSNYNSYYHSESEKMI